MLDNETKDLAKDLFRYMKNKFEFDRDPKIKFKNSTDNAQKILGKTGHYDPEGEEICVYVTNRHPKDVLRSLAHEIMHHVQVCEGKMKPEQTAAAADENYIVHDEHLKEMERDAFERGNITFREWEASKKMDKDVLTEAKKKKRKLTTKQYKKAKKMATSMEKKQGYDAEKAHKIAFAQVQKESMEQIMSDDKSKKENNEKDVEVNEILKNSHYYRPEDRACNDMYTSRDELIFQEMLKKFGIKK